MRHTCSRTLLLASALGAFVVLGALAFPRPVLANPLVAMKDIGGDGRDDLATMYDYGSGKIAFFAFDSTGTGTGTHVTPRKLWGSTSGWTGSRVTPLLADVTGDGKADVVAAYDYGSAKTGMWVTPGSAGTSSPSKWWQSGTGDWSMSKTKLSSARAFSGTGPNDPVALYDYGSNTSGLWVFNVHSASLFAPVRIWKSGTGAFSWSRSKMIAGDFDGDGKGDVAILYDYGSGTSGIWLFRSNGSTYVPSLAWKSAAGGFPWANCKLSVGDFDGDGADELMVRYEYGPGGQTGLWRFDAAGATMTPHLMAKTYHFFWSLPVEASDVTNDGTADVCVWGPGTEDIAASWDMVLPAMGPTWNDLDGLWESAPHAWNFSQSKMIP